MNRFAERKEDYKNALSRLTEALEEEPTEIVIDGILHRFEFTFELAWKTIKDYLEYMGISDSIGSPRENIKLAYKQGIISDGELWIEIMLARNSLSHLYDELTSRGIYNKIKKEYIKAFKELEEKFDNIL
jgi:nucleotidyltransferase substrate binding protein (TIGR01987 family)